ncbi:uncharacterized protein [Rutidosis leptorrhynchoides]|uniref:uncharacterized protein n=1 Tax=Rutidosis leptorrhynchoides TaxID=125765 RepID=UPI003A99C1E5
MRSVKISPSTVVSPPYNHRIHLHLFFHSKSFTNKMRCQNAMPKPDPGSGSGSEVKRDPAPLDSIRMSLKNLRMDSPKSTEDARRNSPYDKTGFNLNLNLNLRPTSENAVPGSNMKNNKRSSVSNETKPDFMRSYGYLDLGSKLKKLRPVTKNNEFSLSELNERLKKVREMDDKEMQNTSGLKFSHLRESLAKLQNEEIQKKNAGKRSVLSELGTPHFMLAPPKEDLVEKASALLFAFVVSFMCISVSY